MNLYRLILTFPNKSYDISNIEKINVNDIHHSIIDDIKRIGYTLNGSVIIDLDYKVNIESINKNNFLLLHSKALSYLREEKLNELL